MKKMIICIVLFCFIMPASTVAKTKQKKIHPSFLRLLKLYPRKQKVIYPSVPRISAKDAYYLFKAKKAILFGVGQGMTDTILGTTILSGNREMSPQLLKKLKTIKNVHILLFCG